MMMKLSLNFSFRYINYFLLSLSAVFLLASIGNFIFSKKSFKFENLDKTQIEVSKVNSTNSPFILKEGESLQDVYSSKKLFHQLTQTSRKPTARVVTIDDVLRDYELIGVVTQGEPEAIVKNRRTRDTTFVNKGATLGELKVEDILDEGIVVSYKGNQKTLRLE